MRPSVRFDYWFAQLPEFPPVGGRKALKLNAQEMATALVHAELGATPRAALRKIGLSQDTIHRYELRAKDDDDPFGPHLDEFFELLHQAYANGVRDRAAALDDPFGGEVDETSPALTVPPGFQVHAIQDQIEYTDADGQRVRRTVKMAPRPVVRSTGPCQSDAAQRLLQVIHDQIARIAEKTHRGSVSDYCDAEMDAYE
jgi:hypothetical protein